MNTRLAIVAGLSAIMLWRSWSLATGNALEFYPVTFLYMGWAACAFLVAAVGMLIHKGSNVMFVVSNIILGLLFIPARFVSNRWPGGDDGGGMAWLFYVIGGSAICSLVAFILFAWHCWPGPKYDRSLREIKQ